MSEDVVYVSNVQIERVKGAYRLAYLPAREDPIAFGTHSEIAEHYGADPKAIQPRTTTLDYLVAAAAG